jgi:BirA family transcriptional regulator, biotin operon repressor / biotin---[acetyl-CoA-carboxylase] ligase
MPSPPPSSYPLEAGRVASLLGPLSSRFGIEVYPAIDSTSSELKRRGDGAIDGVVIAAETQSAGRGRHGRTWVDQPGGSLLFSLGWHAPVPASRLAGLTLATGVAVCRALERQGILRTQLKWPNDLLFRHCKLGGILVETLNSQTDTVDVIIGIGINVRLDAPARDAVAAPVTDLVAAGWTGRRDQLLAGILAELGPALDRFAQHGFHPFRAEWLARHALQGRNVTIWSSGHEIAAGKAIDIDDDGALLLQTPTGVRRFWSGELTLRPD